MFGQSGETAKYMSTHFHVSVVSSSDFISQNISALGLALQSPPKGQENHTSKENLWTVSLLGFDTETVSPYVRSWINMRLKKSLRLCCVEDLSSEALARRQGALLTLQASLRNQEKGTSKEKK